MYQQEMLQLIQHLLFLTLRNGSTTYTALTGQAVNNANYQIKAFTVNPKVCQSISFKLLQTDGKIDINDINIDYRQTNKRPS